MLLAIASIVQAPLLFLIVPVVAGLFLVAPAIGVFRHNESPDRLATVRLLATNVEHGAGADPGESRFRLTLMNDGDADARNFRIRLLIPHAVIPREAGGRPLGTLHVGTHGVHWFIDSMVDSIAITFRADPRESTHDIVCVPGTQLDLADLVIPAQLNAVGISLEYQISGGSTKATLSNVVLRSSE